MLHHPDNTTEDPPLLTQWSFSGAFSAVVALVNLFAIVAAAADRSWVAIGIALIYGPAANLIAAVAGTVIVLRRRGPDFPADGPMLLAWLLPIGFIGADFLVISSMSLGGC